MHVAYVDDIINSCFNAKAMKNPKIVLSKITI